MESIQAVLKGVHLFKNLTDEEMTPIIEITQKRNYRRNMILFMQGDPLTQVYFMVTGKIKVYRTDISGREQIISIQQSGDMFPHVGFFRQGRYPAHAEVIEDTTILTISINDFETILMQYPQLTIKLFRVLGERIVDLQNRLEELTLHNTYERVILLLLRLGNQYGVKSNGAWTRLNSRFTNIDLANMIGTSRETVNRTLAQLKKEELIELDEKGYYLLNMKGLDEHLF